MAVHDHPLWELEKSFRHLDYRPEYGVALGDALAGLVLSQIIYWMKPDKQKVMKAKIIKDGLLWIAKSREQWMAETGLSRKEYIRVMKFLADQGLIFYEMHGFQGKKTPFISLNFQAVVLLMTTGCTQTVQSSGVPLSQSGTTHCTESVQPQGYCCPVSVQPNKEITKSKITNPDYTATSAENPMPDASSILKNHQEKQNQKTGASIYTLWEKHVHGVTGEFVKPLTGKDKGQLKLFVQKAGDDAAAVMVYCIQNWGKFGWAVKDKKGFGTCGSVPQIGQLLQHVDVAVNLWSEQQKLVPSEVPVQSIAVVSTSPLTDEELEQQEVLEYFKGLQKAKGKA